MKTISEDVYNQMLDEIADDMWSVGLEFLAYDHLGMCIRFRDDMTSQEVSRNMLYYRRDTRLRRIAEEYLWANVEDISEDAFIQEIAEAYKDIFEKWLQYEIDTTEEEVQ